MNYHDPLFWKLVTIPFISAFIGWGTNWLAVKMIFRPRKEINFCGLKIQGLVPKRQADLAASIGHTVEEHLLSHADINAILEKHNAYEKLDAMVRERIFDFIEHKLKKLNPMVGMFLSSDMKVKMQNVLLEEVRLLIPQVTETMMDKLESELNFQQIVEEKVRQFDLDRLEKIIFGIASRELKAIEVIGGVLGFILGLIQVGIMLIG